jgi:hypothetical protein
MISPKNRLFIGIAIALFSLSLSALVIWLMLLRGPALVQ